MFVSRWDVSTIRSRFIQENLSKALSDSEEFSAWLTVREFKKYFQWFEDTLPEADRHYIREQLNRLEQLTSTRHEQAV